MLDLLRIAAEYAVKEQKDERVFLLGAVGVRKDSAIVKARNAAINDSERHPYYVRFPEAHAEVRLTRKLGFDSTVYVARVARGTGQLAMARPCEICQNVLQAFRVKKVYYTISDNEWGVWFPNKNIDRYFSRRTFT